VVEVAQVPAAIRILQILVVQAVAVVNQAAELQVQPELQVKEIQVEMLLVQELQVVLLVAVAAVLVVLVELVLLVLDQLHHIQEVLLLTQQEDMLQEAE
jgi:hypothetical protein